MEVSKVPPADVSTARAGAGTVSDQGSRAATSVAPPADRADIRPLDISGALLILLAEMRAGFDLPADATLQSALMQSPVQAARELANMFLQALPEDASNAPISTAMLVRVEAAAQSSIERAVGVVTQWQDVPAAVVDGAKETRALFLSAVGEDPQNPLWLRPEWVGLAPGFQRFRRRRRDARRRLTDPDYLPASLDEDEDEECR
jgi:hypothetical protein